MPRIFLLSVCLAAATAGAQAPAPAPAAPVAEPVVAEAAPLAETETKLTFDERLGAGGVDIREQAKIELLDIDSLRAVYDRKGENETLRLSLTDCIALALAQNNDILIAELEPQSSDAEIYAAKGEFDPVWQTTIQYLNAKQSLTSRPSRSVVSTVSASTRRRSTRPGSLASCTPARSTPSRSTSARKRTPSAASSRNTAPPSAFR
jgi:hypothetical protein